jgi:hypothetical protein
MGQRECRKPKVLNKDKELYLHKRKHKDRAQKMKILVVYYSLYGHIHRMAEALWNEGALVGASKIGEK